MRNPIDQPQPGLKLENKQGIHAFTPLATQRKRDFGHVSDNRNRGPNSVCIQVILHLLELTGPSRCTSYLDWMEQCTSKCRGLGSSNRSIPPPVLKVA